MMDIDYKKAIVELLEKVENEAIFKRVYGLLQFLWLKEGEQNAGRKL